MANKDYVCPACKSPLGGWVCKNCNTDIREIFKAHVISDDDLTSALIGLGAYYMNKGLVLPGSVYWPEKMGNPIEWKYDPIFRTDLALAANVPQATLSPGRLSEYFRQLWRCKTMPFPHVVVVTQRPMLLEGGDGQLYFPALGSVGSRFFGRGQMEEPGTGRLVEVVSLYQGPPLQPQDHGGLFEEFLSSFRCVDEDNVHVIRSWCYSVMISHLIEEGQFPALCVASDKWGAGKSTTAQLLMRLFGGGVAVVARQLERIEDLIRVIMSSGTEFLLADNMRNEGGKLIDNSDLAALLTLRELTTKKLYETAGHLTTPNKLNYIVTANQPLFSPELLSRMVVTTLKAPRRKKAERPDPAEFARQKSWAQTWLARRSALLEDLMWHIIQNWQRGWPVYGYEPTRFVQWWYYTYRAMGRAPIIVPRRTAVWTPLQRALSLCWKGEAAGRVPVDTVVDWLSSANHSEVVAVRRQQEWSADAIVEDLRNYDQQFYAEQDEEEQAWIVKRF